MTTSTPHAGSAVITLTRAALGLLFLAVIGGQIAAVFSAQAVVDSYPEFADLQGPLVTAAIAFGMCVQTVLVITGILAGHTRDGRIFGPQALRLVDVTAGVLVTATLLILGTLFFIPGPPALGLLILGCALVAATITLVLLVLRALLHRAAFMRVELDEVI
ncbi:MULTISPECIES: DUF2975 domain-containing protein [Arthrobacter]|uniref:DUF2975 domain-containing protein n=1 Tax=Arthrobacter TaxID=1663 RepID=UPI000B018A29|nr:DUF2975 domain-containing protein [Arthrobacter sp. Edens01]